MAKINFANTTKLGFWDFVIDATDKNAPKLVSGDYKDLRAKIESGELIDGVVVLSLRTAVNGFAYQRLTEYLIIDKVDSPVTIGLAFDKLNYTIEENNMVRIVNTPPDEEESQ